MVYLLHLSWLSFCPVCVRLPSYYCITQAFLWELQAYLSSATHSFTHLSYGKCEIIHLLSLNHSVFFLMNCKLISSLSPYHPLFFLTGATSLSIFHHCITQSSFLWELQAYSQGTLHISFKGFFQMQLSYGPLYHSILFSHKPTTALSPAVVS